jgi:hypothetical protein
MSATELSALSQTESRALAYATQSGRAIGGLRVVRSLLEAASEYPDMRDYYLGRAGEYTNDLLTEIDPEGSNGNGQTAEQATAEGE